MLPLFVKIQKRKEGPSTTEDLLSDFAGDFGLCWFGGGIEVGLD